MKLSLCENLSERSVISRLPTFASLALACLLPQMAAAADDLRVTTDASSTVQVYLTVKSGSGNPISGLKQDAFQLSEDRATQTINGFSDLPVTTVFVMDYSRSNENSVTDMENAVKGFIDLMDPQDEAAIITFNQDVTVNQKLTDNHNDLKAAAEAGVVAQNSRLYDAIDAAIGQINRSTKPQSTRTIIVLSDGYDVGSTLSLSELSTHLNGTDVSVFPIGYGSSINTKILLNLAAGTGGLYYSSATDSGQFSNIFTEISDRLSNEYRLSYTTAVSGCGSHTIDVNVDTDEGTKSYTGSFDRCVTVDADTSTAAAPKKGGGSLDLATLLAGVLSLSIVRRTHRKDSNQA